MLPKILIHNSISIDGSLTDFEPNMELHYKIVGSFRPDMHLIGSNTIIKGIELYGDGVPQEEERDFVKQQRDKNLPYWAIIDTGGKLKGILHTIRRFEFCRDVIILACNETPDSYLIHLKERDYDFFISGHDHINLETALEYLADRYGAKTILTDTGRILGNILLNRGLVSEISLLIHPEIVGKKSYNMFNDIDRNLKLKLVKNEVLENEYVWIVYRVEG